MLTRPLLFLLAVLIDSLAAETAPVTFRYQLRFVQLRVEKPDWESFECSDLTSINVMGREMEFDCSGKLDASTGNASMTAFIPIYAMEFFVVKSLLWSDLRWSVTLANCIYEGSLHIDQDYGKELQDPHLRNSQPDWPRFFITFDYVLVASDQNCIDPDLPPPPPPIPTTTAPITPVLTTKTFSSTTQTSPTKKPSTTTPPAVSPLTLSPSSEPGPSSCDSCVLSTTLAIAEGAVLGVEVLFAFAIWLRRSLLKRLSGLFSPGRDRSFASFRDSPGGTITGGNLTQSCSYRIPTDPIPPIPRPEWNFDGIFDPYHTVIPPEDVLPINTLDSLSSNQDPALAAEVPNDSVQVHKATLETKEGKAALQKFLEVYVENNDESCSALREFGETTKAIEGTASAPFVAPSEDWYVSLEGYTNGDGPKKIGRRLTMTSSRTGNIRVVPSGQQATAIQMNSPEDDLNDFIGSVINNDGESRTHSNSGVDKIYSIVNDAYAKVNGWKTSPSPLPPENLL